MWRRDVAGYGRRRVACEPSLCEEQSVQPAADNLQNILRFIVRLTRVYRKIDLLYDVLKFHLGIS